MNYSNDKMMEKLMAELCDCLRGLKYEELKDKKVVLDCLRSKNKDLLFELVKSLDHDEYNTLVNIVKSATDDFNIATSTEELDKTLKSIGAHAEDTYELIELLEGINRLPDLIVGYEKVALDSSFNENFRDYAKYQSNNYKNRLKCMIEAKNQFESYASSPKAMEAVPAELKETYDYMLSIGINKFYREFLGMQGVKVTLESESFKTAPCEVKKKLKQTVAKKFPGDLDRRIKEFFCLLSGIQVVVATMEEND